MNLDDILDKHQLWVQGVEDGVRANLQGADLQGANLRGANLQDANLRGAKLQGANLRYADLRYADLRGAKLQGANLLYADLQDANLQDANLRGAKIQNCIGNSAEIKSIRIFKYAICSSLDIITVGCRVFDKKSVLKEKFITYKSNIEKSEFDQIKKFIKISLKEGWL